MFQLDSENRKGIMHEDTARHTIAPTHALTTADTHDILCARYQGSVKGIGTRCHYNKHTIGERSRNLLCSLKTKNGPNTEVQGNRQYPMYSRKEGSEATLGGIFSPLLENLGSRSNPSEIIRITITINEPAGQSLVRRSIKMERKPTPHLVPVLR